MARVLDDERMRIVEMLRGGMSQTRAAKESGRSSGLVNKIAREEGIVSIHNVKKANDAREAYAEERRLEIIGKGFDKADDILAALKEPRDFQAWTVGFGTLIDKARLESGEATSRHESIDPERRKKMRESLDEVAARRRKNSA